MRKEERAARAKTRTERAYARAGVYTPVGVDAAMIRLALMFMSYDDTPRHADVDAAITLFDTANIRYVTRCPMIRCRHNMRECQSMII